MVLAVAVFAAGCSTGVGAAPESDCAPTDLSCALLDVNSLAAVFGERIDVSTLPFERGQDNGRWCDRVVPAPVRRVDAAFQATSQIDGSTVVMTVSSMYFDGADAEITTTAVSGLAQGCAWLEGTTSLQILDELDTSEHGEELVGLLIRTEPLALGGDGTSAGVAPAENMEVVLIRRGPYVSQLAILPAQDDALLLNEILTELDRRLAGVAP